MFFHDYNNRKAGIYKMPDISVLIIDDEPSILKAVSMTLKQEHIAVTCADNGTLALDILKANTFDLILLDIIMPDQDGFSILKVIRSSQNYTPVILLSGRGEDSAPQHDQRGLSHHPHGGPMITLQNRSAKLYWCLRSVPWSGARISMFQAPMR